MLTLGGATLGYCATGSARIDATPASMITIEITHANTGRLAKNRASMSASLPLPLPLRRCGRGGRGAGRRDLGRMHRHAGRDLVEPLDDQPVAGGQAAG